MREGPELYTNKPKKAQLKQYQQRHLHHHRRRRRGSQATVTPPNPQPPKESFARHYKFIWPLLSAVNFTVGAYLFTRTKKKDVGTEEVESPDVPTTPVLTSAASATVIEKSPTPPPVMEPAKLRVPISEDQQHELFKWMLEGKRKGKPKDAEEKKCNDEEKVILKELIRAKTIPSL